MQHQFLKKIVSISAMASMLAMSLPVSAATTITSFKVARDSAVADGKQYFAFNYGVTNPGADIKIGTQSIATPAGAFEYGGVVKFFANNSLFPIASGNGAKIDLTMSSGDKTSAPVSVYVYKGIKFDTSVNSLSLSGSPIATSGATLIIKKGSQADLKITPMFAYSAIDQFAPAAETFLVLGGKEFKVDNQVATSVDALPNGKFKAFFRGYNYATTDKKKSYHLDSAAYINLNVLAKPELSNVSIAGNGAITTKNGRCVIAAKARNTDDMAISWSGKNLTKLTLRLTKLDGTTVDYLVPTPNKASSTVYFQPDCLTPAATGYKMQLVGENTKDYAVASQPADARSVVIAQ